MSSYSDPDMLRKLGKAPADDASASPPPVESASMPSIWKDGGVDGGGGYDDPNLLQKLGNTPESLPPSVPMPPPNMGNSPRLGTPEAAAAIAARPIVPQVSPMQRILDQARARVRADGGSLARPNRSLVAPRVPASPATPNTWMNSVPEGREYFIPGPDVPSGEVSFGNSELASQVRPVPQEFAVPDGMDSVEYLTQRYNNAQTMLDISLQPAPPISLAQTRPAFDKLEAAAPAMLGLTDFEVGEFARKTNAPDRIKAALDLARIRANPEQARDILTPEKSDKEKEYESRLRTNATTPHKKQPDHPVQDWLKIGALTANPSTMGIGVMRGIKKIVGYDGENYDIGSNLQEMQNARMNQGQQSLGRVQDAGLDLNPEQLAVEDIESSIRDARIKYTQAEEGSAEWNQIQSDYKQQATLSLADRKKRLIESGLLDEQALNEMADNYRQQIEANSDQNAKRKEYRTEDYESAMIEAQKVASIAVPRSGFENIHESVAGDRDINERDRIVAKEMTMRGFPTQPSAGLSDRQTGVMDEIARSTTRGSLSLGGAVTQLFDAKTARFLQDVAEDKSLASSNAASSPMLQSIIRGDFSNIDLQMAKLFGEQLPIFASMAITGGIGAGASRLTALASKAGIASRFFPAIEEGGLVARGVQATFPTTTMMAIEGGQHYHDAYQDAIQKGIDPEQAQKLAAIESVPYGIVAGILEVFPYAHMFRGGKAAEDELIQTIGQAIKRVGIQTISEGGTEALQGLAEEISGSLSGRVDMDRDEMNKAIMRVLEQGFAGALMGAAVGGAESAGAISENKRFKNKNYDRFKAIIQSRIAEGMDPIQEGDDPFAQEVYDSMQAIDKQNSLVSPGSDGKVEGDETTSQTSVPSQTETVAGRNDATSAGGSSGSEEAGSDRPQSSAEDGLPELGTVPGPDDARGSDEGRDAGGQGDGQAVQSRAERAREIASRSNLLGKDVNVDSADSPDTVRVSRRDGVGPIIDIQIAPVEDVQAQPKINPISHAQSMLAKLQDEFSQQYKEAGDEQPVIEALDDDANPISIRLPTTIEEYLGTAEGEGAARNLNDAERTVIENTYTPQAYYDATPILNADGTVIRHGRIVISENATADSIIASGAVTHEMLHGFDNLGLISKEELYDLVAESGKTPAITKEELAKGDVKENEDAIEKLEEQASYTLETLKRMELLEQQYIKASDPNHKREIWSRMRRTWKAGNMPGSLNKPGSPWMTRARAIVAKIRGILSKLTGGRVAPPVKPSLAQQLLSGEWSTRSPRTITREEGEIAQRRIQNEQAARDEIKKYRKGKTSADFRRDSKAAHDKLAEAGDALDQVLNKDPSYIQEEDKANHPGGAISLRLEKMEKDVRNWTSAKGQRAILEADNAIQEARQYIQDQSNETPPDEAPPSSEAGPKSVPGQPQGPATTPETGDAATPAQAGGPGQAAAAGVADRPDQGATRPAPFRDQPNAKLAPPETKATPEPQIEPQAPGSTRRLAQMAEEDRKKKANRGHPIPPTQAGQPSTKTPFKNIKIAKPTPAQLAVRAWNQSGKNPYDILKPENTPEGLAPQDINDANYIHALNLRRVLVEKLLKELEKAKRELAVEDKKNGGDGLIDAGVDTQAKSDIDTLEGLKYELEYNAKKVIRDGTIAAYYQAMDRAILEVEQNRKQPGYFTEPGKNTSPYRDKIAVGIEPEPQRWDRMDPAQRRQFLESIEHKLTPEQVEQVIASSLAEMASSGIGLARINPIETALEAMAYREWLDRRNDEGQSGGPPANQGPAKPTSQITPASQADAGSKPAPASKAGGAAVELESKFRLDPSVHHAIQVPLAEYIEGAGEAALAPRSVSIGTKEKNHQTTYEQMLADKQITKAQYNKMRWMYGSQKADVQHAKASAKTNHRTYVKTALAEGLTVPPEVLADYPDLDPATGPADGATVGPAPTPAEQWQAMDPEARRKAVIDAGLVRKDGQISRKGTDLVKKSWEDMTPAQQRLIDAVQRRDTGSFAGDKVEGVEGKATTVTTADGKNRKARYMAVEASEAQTSHDPLKGFAKNPLGDQNERPYHDKQEGKASRDLVRQMAKDTERFGLMLSDTTSPTDGPPILADTGQVLGGNARAMSVQVAYAQNPEQAAAKKQQMVEAAEKFGLDPDAVAAMDRPLIVRVLDDAGKPGELSRVLNDSLTTAKTQATDAVSRAAKVSGVTAEVMAGMFEPDAEGNMPSAREIMANPAKADKLVQRFVRDGVFSQADVTRYVDDDGSLTDAGKLLVEQVMLARLIPDARVVSRLPDKARNNLMAAMASWVRAGQVRPKDLELLATAAEALPEYLNSGATLIDYFHKQGSMQPPPGFGDPRVAALVHGLMTMGTRQFREASARYLDLAGIASDTAAMSFMTEQQAENPGAGMVEAFGGKVAKTLAGEIREQHQFSIRGEQIEQMQGWTLDGEKAPPRYIAEQLVQMAQAGVMPPQDTLAAWLYLRAKDAQAADDYEVHSAKGFRIGDTFTIHGERFEVVTPDKDPGVRVMRQVDGDLRMVLDGMDQVPVDKGSLQRENIDDPESEHHVPFSIAPQTYAGKGHWQTSVDDATGRNIVYDDGEYQIAVNKPGKAAYATLFAGGKKVGELATYEGEGKWAGYLRVSGIEIDKSHRGNGMSTRLYQALAAHNSEAVGIVSYLPDRINKKQIPSVYRRFQSRVDGDNEIIDIDRGSPFSLFSLFRGEPINMNGQFHIEKQEVEKGDIAAKEVRMAPEAKAGYRYTSKHGKKSMLLADDFGYTAGMGVITADKSHIPVKTVWYERKLGKWHPIWRLSIIKGPEGPYTKIENGVEHDGSPAGVEVSFKGVSYDELEYNPALKPVMNRLARLWQDYETTTDSTESRSLFSISNPSYFDIGHGHQGQAWWMMNGSLQLGEPGADHLESGAVDWNGDREEGVGSALGQIDHEKKQVSVRPVGKAGASQIRSIDRAVKMMSREYPDYSIVRFDDRWGAGDPAPSKSPFSIAAPNNPNILFSIASADGLGNLRESLNEWGVVGTPLSPDPDIPSEVIPKDTPDRNRLQREAHARTTTKRSKFFSEYHDKKDAAIQDAGLKQFKMSLRKGRTLSGGASRKTTGTDDVTRLFNQLRTRLNKALGKPEKSGASEALYYSAERGDQAVTIRLGRHHGSGMEPEVNIIPGSGVYLNGHMATPLSGDLLVDVNALAERVIQAAREDVRPVQFSLFNPDPLYGQTARLTGKTTGELFDDLPHEPMKDAARFGFEPADVARALMYDPNPSAGYVYGVQQARAGKNAIKKVQGMTAFEGREALRGKRDFKKSASALDKADADFRKGQEPEDFETESLFSITAFSKTSDFDDADVQIKAKFSIAPVGDRMVGLHNISVDNLRFIDKMGGQIAMPSLAIASEKHPLENFGDISLIAPRDMIDPGKSRKTRVYDADAYSPRYPRAMWTMTPQFFKAFEPIERWAKETYGKYSSPLAQKQDYSVRTLLLGGKNHFDNDESASRGPDEIKRNRGLQVYWLATQRGKVFKNTDSLEDLQEIQELINAELPAYEAWVQETLGQHMEPGIWAGYTPSGNRRKPKPYTIDAVMREMRKALRSGEGEGFFYGAGSVRAKVAKRYNTISGIQKDRGRLVDAKTMETGKEALSNKMLEVSLENSASSLRKTGIGWSEKFWNAVLDAQKSGRKVMQEYGIDPDKVDWASVNGFLDDLRNAPTEYFEAKLDRVVNLSEFGAAVVPEGEVSAARDILARNGIDRIETYQSNDPESRKQAVVRAAESIEAAGGRSLFSIRTTPNGETFKTRQLDDLGFYSPAVEWAQGLKMKPTTRMTPEQIRGQLKKAPVKQEELEWMGLDDWLNGRQKVTKQELVDFLQQNQVSLEEVVHEENDVSPDEIQVQWDSSEDGYMVYDGDDPIGDPYEDEAQAEAAAEEYRERYGDSEDRKLVKHSKWQLPGGKNYRELLITTPAQAEQVRKGFAQKEALPNGRVLVRLMDSGVQESFASQEEADAFIKESAEKSGAMERPGSYKSSHFDTPNILAHVRMNERTDAQGRRVLFLEEVQSDWHQAGRKEGYGEQVELPDGVKIVRKQELTETQMDALPGRDLGTPQDWVLLRDDKPVIPSHSGKLTRNQALREMVASAKEADLIIPIKAGVPDAPYKNTWPDLALKRMIRWAAVHNFDAVAWTTGEQQAQRYDLSKQVDSVRWVAKPGSESGRLTATKNGSRVLTEETTRDKIADFIGKEPAQKLLDATPETDDAKTEWREISGLDLTVGGDGMKAFYDVQLPRIANKLGKKYGAKTATAEFSESENGKTNGKDGFTAHALPITPELQDAAGQGMARFSIGINYSDIGHQDGALLWWMGSKGKITVKSPKKISAADAFGGSLDDTVDAIHEDYDDAQSSILRGRIDPQKKAISITMGIDGSQSDNPAIQRAIDRAYTELSEKYPDHAIFEFDLESKGTKFGLSAMQGNLLDIRHEVEQMKIGPKATMTGLQAINLLKKAGVESNTPAWGMIDNHLRQRQSRVNKAELLNLIDAVAGASAIKYSFAHNGLHLTDGFTIPNDNAWLWFRRGIQDKFLAVKRLQEAIAEHGGRISEASDVYLHEEAYGDALAEALRRFDRDYQEPLLDALVKSKLSMKEAAALAVARHAEERNALIASRNPDFQIEGLGSLFDDMAQDDATLEAKEIIAKAKEDGSWDAMAPIFEQIDRINEMKLKMAVEWGLITAAKAKSLRQMFKFYVPLKGFAEQDMVKDGMAGLSSERSRRGFDTRQNLFKHALGRKSEAFNPIAQTIADAQMMMVQGHKNKVALSLLKLVRENPDPSLWSINEKRSRPHLDEKTGKVVYRQGWNDNSPNTFIVRENGKIVRITIKNDLIARAMHRMGPVSINKFIRFAGVPTRFIASINTMYSAEFLLTNLLKDTGTSGIHLSGEQSRAFAGQAMAHVFDAMGALFPELRGRDASKVERSLAIAPKTVGSSIYWLSGRALRIKSKGKVYDMSDVDWQKMAREYAEDGGHISLMNITNAEETLRKMERKLKHAADNGLPHKSMDAAREMLDYIGDLNGMIENATRLSAYVVARKHGFSRMKSASLSKNLTTNFSRKGEWSPVIGLFYAFFNAGVQGPARSAIALRNRRVRRICYGLSIAGFVNTMASILLGGDDDDGRSHYSKIPPSIKSRNIILMSPTRSGNYFKIPMPYVYNTFYNFGQQCAEVLITGKSPFEAGMEWAIIAAESGSPIGAGPSIEQILSPTVLDSVIQYTGNETWYGGKMYPERYFNQTTPDSQLSFGGNTQFSKWLAKSINEATGGSPVRSGRVDVHPALFDHIVGSALGSAGTFASKAVNLIVKPASGEHLQSSDIPFIRKFFSDQYDYENYAILDRHKRELGTVQDEIKLWESRGDQSVADRIRSENAALLAMDDPAQRTHDGPGNKSDFDYWYKKQNDLRKQIVELRELDADPSEIERLEKERVKIVKQMNRRLDAARGTSDFD